MTVFPFRVTQAERNNVLDAESFRLIPPPKQQELIIDAKRYEPAKSEAKTEGQYALPFLPLSNRFQDCLEKLDQSLLLQRVLRRFRNF